MALLVVKNSPEFVHSKEGVTQGDSISLFMHAVGSLPHLVRSLKSFEDCIRIWYTDDSPAQCDPLSSLRELAVQSSRGRGWPRETICDIGPNYGYFSNSEKSYLVVGQSLVDDATEVFEEFGARVVTALTDHRVLGGFVGSNHEKDSFVEKKKKHC